jgi:hypothetical protein
VQNSAPLNSTLNLQSQSVLLSRFLSQDQHVQLSAMMAVQMEFAEYEIPRQVRSGHLLPSDQKLIHGFPDVLCPDTMPCRVLCDGLVGFFQFACAGINIHCSSKASCDVLLLKGAGFTAAVNCGNTTQSCAAVCDDASSLGFLKCNTTASCNCASNCRISGKCVSGYEFVLQSRVVIRSLH